MIEKIKSPEDIKRLSIGELYELAGEIRKVIIETVAKNGGHLAPNLGAVELTLALHYVFNSPKDKIIWDVGHQCYTHKLITGRYGVFHTLRQYGGISGFPRLEESPHDVFGTGHASTSISAALGFACARDIKGEDYKVIAVIGDGALTGGMAFEGLNNAAYLKKNLIVVLNDNKMSISENVGGLSQYLRKISLSPVYNELKKDVWELLGRLPDNLGSRARGLVRKIKESLKSFIVPTVLFEELGFRYIGPVDGHNLKVLIDTFEAVKRMKGPILVHVLTEKGRGYTPAERAPSKFHGIGKFDPSTGEPVSSGKSYSRVFGEKMVELGKRYKDLVAITAAMAEGTGLILFAREFPERFFDVGICEQHAVTFAAGLALQGLRVVCAIYSTFLQRAFDQIIHDVCLQKIPVVFCLDRAGIVGEDGPTHHGCFDLSYLRMIPNIVVCAPKDAPELCAMLDFAVEYKKSAIAIRYPRDRAIEIEKTPKEVKLGKWEILKEGKEGYIIAVGSMVAEALKAVEDIPEFGVINARFVKPLDEDMLLAIINRVKKIVTCEENVLQGGFGSAVLEFYEEKGLKADVLRIGIPDRFIEHGERHFLLEKYGLKAKCIREKILKYFGRRGNA